MVDAQKLATALSTMAAAEPPEERRKAERSFEAMLAELIDAKVLRSLCSQRPLEELVTVAMAAGRDLTPAARLVLDRFRYRLAHVAMRNQQWHLAEALLNMVLAGEGDLTRARLFLAICRGRDEGKIPESDLVALLDCHRAELGDRRPRPPLDVLIQDPTTNMLELLLLSQEASSDLFDRLYDSEARHGTTGLTLYINPGVGKAVKVELSEWLAEAHLEEYRQEGWLLVDSTVTYPGDRGRGSELSVPGGNLKAPVLNCVTQILGKRAPLEVQAQVVKERFCEWADGRFVELNDHSHKKWRRVTAAALTDYPDHKVIRRSTGTRGEVNWWLIPPYTVVLSDASTLLH